MFKRLSSVLLVILVILISSTAYSGDEFRKLDNKAFKAGERLTFDVKYGFVTAGVAVMSIPRIKKMSNRDSYNIVFEVNSVPNFDWVYKVRDRYETYMDVQGLFPWRFEQHVREGKYTRDFSAFFDQRRHKAKTSDGEYNVPKYVNDIVSAFYITRTFDYSKMKRGEKIHLQNFFKDKVYDLDVEYHGKETIKVGAGTFDCIIIEPLVLEGGLFKSEGNILIWLTNDNLKIPIKVKTKVVVGAIDAELTKYEGLNGPIRAKK
jgi:hypothetical protein